MKSQKTKQYRLQAPRWPGESAGEWSRRNREFVYEEAVVKHLIRHFHLPEKIGIELWKEEKERSPDDFGRLRLPAFCAKTAFPLWLGSRRFEDVGQPRISNLLSDFASAPWGQAWNEVARAAPARFPSAGIIFPMPGTKFMALHDYASDLQPGATRLVIPQSKQNALVLEPLRCLLEAIKSWRPVPF